MFEKACCCKDMKNRCEAKDDRSKTIFCQISEQASPLAAAYDFDEKRRIAGIEGS